MASANEGIMIMADRPHLPATDWILANPWFWMIAGLGFALVSLLWTLAQGANASDGRVIVLCLGLLCAAGGMWLRWLDRQSTHLLAWQSPLALLLGCVCALLFLGLSGVFIASFVVEDSVGLKSAPIFLIWISFAPACFLAARRSLNRKPQESAETIVHEEISFGFVVLAAVCVLGSFTLYADATNPSDWGTLRMFLRVGAAVSLGAAVLTIVATAVRRIVLSILFTLHFAGICSAALSAPPAPWIVQQAWMRLFRPYLEFAYLNNAYHFYAPEPGPSSYLWFRIIYADAEGKNEEGEWLKIPELDEKTGRIRHPVALDYQRFLSLTEAVMHPDPLPPEYYYHFNPITNTWESEPNLFYKNRLDLVPQNAPVAIGLLPSKHHRIRLHPEIPPMHQVKIPNQGCRQLLSSFARFVARTHPAHPEKPHLKFKSVKIYEVVHWIAPVQWFLLEIPPTDPELYRPYFVGNFDSEGKQIIDGDPYLYWLLPVVRDHGSEIKSQIRDYARLHAGDPRWIRKGTTKEWVEPERADP